MDLLVSHELFFNKDSFVRLENSKNKEIMLIRVDKIVGIKLSVVESGGDISYSLGFRLEGLEDIFYTSFDDKDSLTRFAKKHKMLGLLDLK